jgi:hypothetical protein
MSSKYEARMQESAGGFNQEFLEERTIHNADYRNQVHSKWSPYMANIPQHNTLKRAATAMVMENTIQYMPRALRKAGMLSEDAGTRTQAIADYATTIFPVLMRVFPNLIAHDLVSIQPMSGPVGAVFVFEYKHSTSKGTVQKGDNMIQTFNPYYTSEEIVNEPLETGDGVGLGGAGAAGDFNLDFFPIFPKNSAVSDPDRKVTITELDPDGNVVQQATDTGSGSFTFVPAGGSTAGAINYQTGAVSGFKFQNAPANGNKIVASYFYDMEGNDNIPTMSLDVSLFEIRVKNRKLKVVWSAESADDLRALHGIEGEAQLLAGMSNEIGLEIDREILSEILQKTQTNLVWDRNGAPAGTDELNYLRTILTTLDDGSAQIHNKTGRAPANWLVVNPRVGSLFTQFQSHGDFIPASPTDERPSSYGQLTADYGIFKFGTLANRYRVYLDPVFPVNQILMGLKGQSYLDAGYVYAPYVPLQLTPTFHDPDDGKYKKALRTRYSKKMLRPEYYGKVTIQNMG